jgi:hypothetical protein
MKKSYLIAFLIGLQLNVTAQNNAYFRKVGVTNYSPVIGRGYPQLVERYNGANTYVGKRIISYDQNLNIESIRETNALDQNLRMSNYLRNSSGQTVTIFDRAWINNSWKLIDISSYTYDAHNNMSSNTYLQYNDTTNTWDTVYASKTNISYSGNLITSCEFRSRNSSGQWNINSTYGYVYNAAADVIEFNQSNSLKVKYYYKANRMVDSVTLYHRDTLNNWLPYLRQKNFVYDTWNGDHHSSKISYMEEDQLHDGIWRPKKWSTTQLPNGGYEFTGLFFENNMWLKEKHRIAAFDSYGEISKSITDNAIGNEWYYTNGREYIYDYDADGRMLEMIEKGYSGSYVPTTSNYVQMSREVYSSFVSPTSVSENVMPALNSYPNPAANELMIARNFENGIGGEIINEIGIRVLQFKATESKIDVSGFPVGFYVLSYENGKKERLMIVR